MNILLFDDDKLWCEHAKSIIERLDGFRNAEITMMNDEKLFLEKVQDSNPDLIFMDIEIDGSNQNGIHLVEAIQKKHSQAQIVFCTNYLQYALDIYNSNHCYYVIKEQFEERLPEIMRIVEEKIRAGKESVSIMSGSDVIQIPQADIVFVERLGRTNYVHTVHEKIETKESMEKIWEKLNHMVFVRCHKSYIVSLSYVKVYKRSSLLVSTGEAGEEELISISRPNIQSVKDAVWRYFER